MEILDIHTHHYSSHPEKAIYAYAMKDMPFREKVNYCSAGIHPWFLTREDFQAQLDWLSESVQRPEVIALGEAGLDKLTITPFDLQVKVFREVIEFADKVGKPLIIHAVRASNEIIALKKEYKPHNPWIIHGFRGKKEIAEAYLRQGICLSFGDRFQEKALEAVSLDHLFLETDESLEPIESIYRRIAEVYGITSEELVELVQQNIRNIFFNS